MEEETAVNHSHSRSEGGFGGAAAPAIFSVEDLLDFSNEEEQLGEDENESVARCCLPDSDDGLSSNGTTESSSVVPGNGADLDAVAGLCAVPYEELAELEWLSGHLEEEEPVLSSEDIRKLRLISGSGAANPKTSSSPSLSSSSSSSTLTSCHGASNSTDRCSCGSTSSHDNNGATLLRSAATLLPAEAVVHQPPLRGARSKRSRADPGSWASRLAMLLMTSTTTTTATESSSSADLDLLHGGAGFVPTCSSSSSSYTTDAVAPLPVDPPRKKPKPQKTNKAPLQQQPLPSTYARAHPDGDGRRCLHCATDKTPQWRTGPMGPKTLCNACGVRYKSGRLVPEYRPAASPTFVVSKHSNSHRKVMELRRQKEQHRTTTTMLHLPSTACDAGGDTGTGAPPLLLQHNNGGRRSHAHLFPPLSAGTGLYEAAAGVAATDDFLIHHHVGPDFRHLI